MFSGIVEDLGLVAQLKKIDTNLHITIRSKLSPEAYIDQSIAHNGVCLTVVEFDQEHHTVVAIAETLERTNLGILKEGDLVNLERSILPTQRLDGHFVQGHVDCTTTCIKIEDMDGSWNFTFSLDSSRQNLVVLKGSITINGVSLTISDIQKDSFSVSIIPYTFNQTNFKKIKVGDSVNIEFDILGKYILKNIATFINSSTN